MTRPPDGGGVDGGVPWRRLVTEAEGRLKAAGFDSAEIDARRIVEQASGNQGAAFFSGLDELATVRGVAHFDSMVERRLTGEPLQYVLGEWSFRALDLFVDARVLIPRPETETVVEVALAEFDRIADRRGGDVPVTVVDLGTGSGAIALSFAFERPRAQVWATDRSADALAVARANLTGIGRAATRVTLREGAWFDALPSELRGHVDLLVSNPPYVAAADDLPLEVSGWEPSGALVAGPRGTEDVEHLIDHAGAWLAADGSLVLEMAPHQTEAMATRARDRGYGAVEVADDLTGRARLVIARRITAAGC